jgi:hypothetical protein
MTGSRWVDNQLRSSRAGIGAPNAVPEARLWARPLHPARARSFLGARLVQGGRPTTAAFLIRRAPA